jgi:DGQHR domain-containing protein
MMATRSKTLSIPVFAVTQGDLTFYLFAMAASELWRLTEINQRSEEKEEGYQRALSRSRVRQVARYLRNGGVIPGSIIVSFKSGKYNSAKKALILSNKANIGWIIDGQHRLAGAHEASKDGLDVVLPVVAFIKLQNERQIDFFITINREARSVPASLYIDLLKELPRIKTEKELTDERIADIARQLDSDELSPFYQRIIFTRSARAGELSLNNFARILRPHVALQSGTLGIYTQIEQLGAIDNYYKGLMATFPRLTKREPPILFRTIGFGAVWRAFPYVFQLANAKYKSFSVASIGKIFGEIRDFDFDSWTQLGTGTAAENQAGLDLIAALQEAFADDESGPIALKLD